MIKKRIQKYKYFTRLIMDMSSRVRFTINSLLVFEQYCLELMLNRGSVFLTNNLNILRICLTFYLFLFIELQFEIYRIFCWFNIQTTVLVNRGFFLCYCIMNDAIKLFIKPVLAPNKFTIFRYRIFILRDEINILIIVH